MLLIPCPICGPRDEIEFSNGGPAQIARPAQPDQVSDEVWADYLFNRENPMGELTERWLHAGGCRRWFTLVRCTITHEITSVRRLDDSQMDTAA